MVGENQQIHFLIFSDSKNSFINLTTPAPAAAAGGAAPLIRPIELRAPRPPLTARSSAFTGAHERPAYATPRAPLALPPAPLVAPCTPRATGMASRDIYRFAHPLPFPSLLLFSSLFPLSLSPFLSGFRLGIVFWLLVFNQFNVFACSGMLFN
jgi:hypothetical protein